MSLSVTSNYVQGQVPITLLSRSPEEHIDQLEQEAGAQAEHLPEAERAAFRTLVRGEIARMRKAIAGMRSDNVRENGINAALGELVGQFNASKNQFLEGNSKFEGNSREVCDRNQNLLKKIGQCTPKFGLIARPPIDDEDPLPSYLDDVPAKTDLEKRKIIMARCMQEEDAALSLCMGDLTKGLDPEEKKELLEVAYRAPTGAAVNQIAAPLAAISTAFRAAMDAAVAVGAPVLKAYTLGAAHEFCQGADDPQKCVNQLRNGLEGKDPAVNQAFHDAIPNWVNTAGEAMASFDATLHHFDDHMAKTYYTHPGIVKAGAEGALDLTVGAAAGTAFKMGRRALTAVRPGVSNPAPLAKKVHSFIQDEAGTVKLPGSSKPPRERKFYIRLYESIGYEIVPGGKGSHIKMLNPTIPKLPMVIIPKERELSKTVVNSLRRTYEKAIDIYQDLPSTINPAQASLRQGSFPNQLTKFMKDEAGTVRLPFASPLPNSARDAARQNIQDIYETAIRVPNRVANIPAEIDIPAIMDGDLVRNFGRVDGNIIPAMGDAIKEALTCLDFTLKPIPSPNSGNSLFKVLSPEGTPIGVLKEFIANRSPVSGFIPEVVSLKILEKQSLKHSSLPQLEWVGKYTTQNGVEKGVALYRFVPGETMADMLYNQRGALPAAEFGRSLGEINAINHALPVPEHYLFGKVQDIWNEAEFALSQLQERGIPTRLTLRELDVIGRGLKQRPGASGLVHGDAHLGNFLFENNPSNPSTFKATVIDTGSLMQSVNRQGHPQGLPSLDFYQAVNAFRVFDEYEIALGRQAVAPVDNFVAGYREAFPFPVPPEADLFTQIFWEIRTLGHYARVGAPESLLRIRLERIEANFAPPKINGTTLMSSDHKGAILKPVHS